MNVTMPIEWTFTTNEKDDVDIQIMSLLAQVMEHVEQGISRGTTMEKPASKQAIVEWFLRRYGETPKLFMPSFPTEPFPNTRPPT